MKKVSGIYLFSGKKLSEMQNTCGTAEKYKQDKANSSDEFILEPL